MGVRSHGCDKAHAATSRSPIEKTKFGRSFEGWRVWCSAAAPSLAWRNSSSDSMSCRALRSRRRADALSQSAGSEQLAAGPAAGPGVPSAPMTHQQNQFLGEVWGNEKGLAVAASANPSSSMVAGARFELWKRTLTFEFFVTY